jgi:ATP-binding cassette, subfamily B, bacterial
MKLLLGYLKGYRKLVVLALVLAAVNTSFSLIDPLIFRQILDSYVTKLGKITASDFFHGVGGLVLLMMGAALISRTAKNFQDYYTNVLTQKLGVQIYSEGVEHSLKLPYQVFEDQRSGETLGKLQKVRLDTEKVIQAAVSFVFTTLIGVIFVIIYSFYVHWAIAPAYFFGMGTIAWMSWVLGKKIKTIQKTIVAQTTALAGSTTESLRNIELVKSLGLASQEIGRLNATTDKILQLELKKVKYVRSLSFLQGSVVNALRNGILFLMLYLVFIHEVTFGQFFALYIYSFFIFSPLQELGNIINTFREAEASLNMFEGVLKMPIERKPEHPISLGTIETLSFEDVSFKHLTASTFALTDVTFSTGRGQTIAFVGPSGAGKTTLVKLLVGLYPPQAGRVLYNKISSQDIDVDELRERIGFVTQDTQLFSGTIRENLLFVNPNATDDECMEVLNKASCQSLLARAPQGLDTVIGEGGVKVSGGEKQRLSIARALLRRPNLLVFDEATSSLDSLTEEEITSTIREVSTSSELITIMIAHRLSTIMHADRIYVLEQGQIVESGKHHDLLAMKGLYYAMWRQQIGERTHVQKNGQNSFTHANGKQVTSGVAVGV